MDMNSEYNGKPTALWGVLLIVFGVGLYYTVLGALYMAGVFDFGTEIEAVEDFLNTFVGVIYILLGLFTLLIGFLVYSGSSGGRTVLTVILVIAILGNAVSLILGDLTSVFMLVLALVCFVLLHQPAVKQYFK